MCNLGVVTLADFLSADVVDELRSGLDADLILDLPNKGISIDFPLIELLVHII